MRILDASADVVLSRNLPRVDGARDLIEIAANCPHAIGEQAKDRLIAFADKRPEAGPFHRKRPDEGRDSHAGSVRGRLQRIELDR